jgi:hypothetical protein
LKVVVIMSVRCLVHENAQGRLILIELSRSE